MHQGHQSLSRILVAGVTLAILVLPAASALGHGNTPEGYEPPPLTDLERSDELLRISLEDATITDTMEAGDIQPPEEGTCAYRSPNTSAPGNPANVSFTHVLFTPSDVAPSIWIDAPKECTGGAVLAGAFSRAPTNAAGWMSRENVGFRVRSTFTDYTHSYKPTKQYRLRSVHRFVSANNKAYWAGISAASRVAEINREFRAAGWLTDGDNRRMAVLLWASSKGGYIGYAQQRYQVAYSVRWNLNSTDNGLPSTLRYGCGTVGDTLNMHETTHVFGVVHPNEADAHDLMHPGIEFTFRSGTEWDMGDAYDHLVRGEPGTTTGNAGATIYDCMRGSEQ